MITLYIKTHRQTGLRYFGKTTRTDPHRYCGSGKHWIRHIKKHGYNCETEIVGVFDNVEEATAVALQFSQDNDIVSSPLWANLKEENGIDGNAKGIVFSDEWIENLKKARSTVVMKEETKEKIRKSHTGKKREEFSQEWRDNIGNSHRGKKRPRQSELLSKQWIVTDPHGNNKIISNLSKFCLENQLNAASMGRVACGDWKHHKGWLCQRV